MQKRKNKPKINKHYPEPLKLFPGMALRVLSCTVSRILRMEAWEAWSKGACVCACVWM